MDLTKPPVAPQSKHGVYRGRKHPKIKFGQSGEVFEKNEKLFFQPHGGAVNGEFGPPYPVERRDIKFAWNDHDSH